MFRISNRTDLEEIVTLPADYRGASLIIPRGKSFLWAISSTDLWRRIGGRQYVYYEGVSGGVEPGGGNGMKQDAK
jgi:hypothetical protein